MSTLHVVEEILRERRIPMVVREIVVAAGERLPTKSKTPDTVVARDLAMDIKRLGGDSRFSRVAPGRYTLKAYVVSETPAVSNGAPVVAPQVVQHVTSELTPASGTSISTAN